MGRTGYVLWALAALTAIVVLSVIGMRYAPVQQAANSAESRQACQVEAPEGLKAAASQWCAVGLFSRVTASIEKEEVIAIVQFSQNGMQGWQMQSGGLVGEFRSLTDRMAADAAGKNIAISVQDPADRRVAACARLNTEKEAKCEAK